MSKHRSSSKRVAPDIGLHMECEEEELEPLQLAFYKKAENEYKEVQAKLERYIDHLKYDVIEKRENCLVLEAVRRSSSDESSMQISTPAVGKMSSQSGQSVQQSSTPVMSNVSTRSGTSTGSSYLIVESKVEFGVQSPKSSGEQVCSTDPSKVNMRMGKKKETTTQRKRRLEKARKAYLLKRLNESEEDRLNRLQQRRIRIESETEEQRKIRTELHRLRQIQARANESFEKAQARREKDRIRHMLLRSTEAFEKRQIRLERQRRRLREMLADDTPERPERPDKAEGAEEPEGRVVRQDAPVVHMIEGVVKTCLQTPGSGSVMVTRGKSKPITPPATRTRDKTRAQGQPVSPQTLTSTAQPSVYVPLAPASNPGNYKIRSGVEPIPIQTSKPSENNALGGLSAGTKTFKSGTDESTGKPSADSKEVTFNKVTGKIFPSLVVVARPNLKVKTIPQYNVQSERSALDTNVKGVLMYSPTRFIEWLIQQGLIRSEQNCQIHLNSDLTPVKLKLGMYSDVSKFPYSGGYVWISDCCPQLFVSVFAGSIFEGAPHPPSTLLKLIYHWACQTNVQNVVQWVKVNNMYLKNFYTSMRAICTQAVHEKYKKMGGPRKKIEVGVISLGTTSQDGNKRQVKVEVLGVMDYDNNLIRLRAVDPLSQERSFKRRFVKILEPLEEWVHKESLILIDFTVAKAALNMMGFSNVYQVTNDSKYSNQNVMEYLRKVVPRMFQNTLSLLSRQIIQQFLDELVWREVWGPIPSQAFVNIISHLAEQTKLDAMENFLIRLNKVAGNPFKKWDYSVWAPSSSVFSLSGSKTPQGTSQESSPQAESDSKGIRTRKRTAEMSIPETIMLPSAKKMARGPLKEKAVKKEPVDQSTDETDEPVDEGEQISLERYYYGVKRGTESLSIVRYPFNVKCCVCNKKFKDNIVLMKHIILHSQLQPMLVIDLKKVFQCEYCFLGFNTNLNLNTHLEEVHSAVDGKLTTNVMCYICEVKFNNRKDLVRHMHKKHVEMEMPYECGVCHFRASVYKSFVDHFLQVHQDEEYVFCPYCLKVVALSHKGEAIISNVFFYMVHLEKHQRLTLAKECERCQLSFIHKGIFDQHMEADHGSWKNESGVKFLEHFFTGMLMRAPDPAIMIKLPLHVKTPKFPKSRNTTFIYGKFKGLEIYGLDDNMACVECEGSLIFSEHFTGIFNCMKCRYTSCCENALYEHVAIFHECKPVQFTKGKPIVLPQELFCTCGYSSRSGNRMAKHLAQCEKETAYVSKEMSVIVKNLNATDKSKTEGQNVLNLLGLVRKSPEASASLSRVADVEVDADAKMELEAVLWETDIKQEAEGFPRRGIGINIEKIPKKETETIESETEVPAIAIPEEEVTPITEEGPKSGEVEEGAKPVEVEESQAVEHREPKLVEVADKPKPEEMEEEPKPVTHGKEEPMSVEHEEEEPQPVRHIEEPKPEEHEEQEPMPVEQEEPMPVEHREEEPKPEEHEEQEPMLVEHKEEEPKPVELEEEPVPVEHKEEEPKPEGHEEQEPMPVEQEKPMPVEHKEEEPKPEEHEEQEPMLMEQEKPMPVEHKEEEPKPEEHEEQEPMLVEHKEEEPKPVELGEEPVPVEHKEEEPKPEEHGEEIMPIEQKEEEPKPEEHEEVSMPVEHGEEEPKPEEHGELPMLVEVEEKQKQEKINEEPKPGEVEEELKPVEPDGETKPDKHSEIVSWPVEKVECSHGEEMEVDVPEEESLADKTEDEVRKKETEPVAGAAADGVSEATAESEAHAESCPDS